LYLQGARLKGVSSQMRPCTVLGRHQRLPGERIRRHQHVPSEVPHALRAVLRDSRRLYRQTNPLRTSVPKVSGVLGSSFIWRWYALCVLPELRQFPDGHDAHGASGVSILHSVLLHSMQEALALRVSMSSGTGGRVARGLEEAQWGAEVPGVQEADREGRPGHLQPHGAQDHRPHPLHPRPHRFLL